MENKNKKEIIIRTQDGTAYYEFEFPLSVDRFPISYRDNGNLYPLRMGDNGMMIGLYKEQKHAIHVMNYLIAKRNYYLFDSSPKIKSVILNVPTDELVRQTADEDLLNGVPTKGENDGADN